MQFDGRDSSLGRYNFDLTLIITTFALCAIGVIFIYSAGGDFSENILQAPYIKQLIFLFIGLLLFVVFLFFLNYQSFSSYAFLLYLLSILVLVFVLIYGTTVHGSSSWFTIKGLSFQPSEITKIFFIIVLAKYITKAHNKINKLSRLLVALAIPVPIVALILLQPDPGTAFVYIPITLVMLLVGGANPKYLLIIISTGLIAIVFSLLPNYYIMINEDNIKQDNIKALVENTSFYALAFSKDDTKLLEKVKLASLKSGGKLRKALRSKNKSIKNIFISFTIKIVGVMSFLSLLCFILYKVLVKQRPLYYFSILFLILTVSIGVSSFGQLLAKPHHTTRILTFLDLNKDPQGSSYHQRQSIIAIGSGGVWGHGLGQGPQNKFNFIPEKTTDFIFAVIGEEWGFLRGSLLVLFLYFIIISRLLTIAYKAKDHFGTLITSGISAMLATHIFVNIAMCIGIWPVMGIPLPLLSAGGSSLVTSLIAIAIVTNVSRKRFIY